MKTTKTIDPVRMGTIYAVLVPGWTGGVAAVFLPVFAVFFLFANLILCGSIHAGEITLLKTSLEGPPTGEFGGGCSLGCAVGWDMTASSELAPQGKATYGVKNIYDCDMKTAWVPTGKGIGESVSFVFKKEHFLDSDGTTFWGLEIINGYIKNEKAWSENSRVRRIQIQHNGKPLCDVQLEDSMEVQYVRIEPFTIRPGSIVKVVILETYPGTRYTDVAITEILPHGAH